MIATRSRSGSAEAGRLSDQRARGRASRSPRSTRTSERTRAARRRARLDSADGRRRRPPLRSLRELVAAGRRRSSRASCAAPAARAAPRALLLRLSVRPPRSRLRRPPSSGLGLGSPLRPRAPRPRRRGPARDVDLGVHSPSACGRRVLGLGRRSRRAAAASSALGRPASRGACASSSALRRRRPPTVALGAPTTSASSGSASASSSALDSSLVGSAHSASFPASFVGRLPSARRTSRLLGLRLERDRRRRLTASSATWRTRCRRARGRRVTVDLLPDELRRVGDDDVVAVDLPDACGRVVAGRPRRASARESLSSANGADGSSASSLPCSRTSKWSRWTWPFSAGGTRKNRRRAAASIGCEPCPPGPASSESTRGWTATRNACAREPVASVAQPALDLDRVRRVGDDEPVALADGALRS